MAAFPVGANPLALEVTSLSSEALRDDNPVPPAARMAALPGRTNPLVDRRNFAFKRGESHWPQSQWGPNLAGALPRLNPSIQNERALLTNIGMTIVLYYKHSGQGILQQSPDEAGEEESAFKGETGAPGFSDLLRDGGGDPFI